MTEDQQQILRKDCIEDAIKVLSMSGNSFSIRTLLYTATAFYNFVMTGNVPTEEIQKN